jgi:ferredoxin
LTSPEPDPVEAIDTHSRGADGTAVAETDPAAPASPVLRRLPALAAPADPAATARALQQFFRTGTLPPDSGLSAGLSGHVPALLFPFLGRPGLRTPWPIVLDESAEDPLPATLSAFMDRVAEAISDAGDEGELRRRFLARVEEAIRTAGLPDESSLEEAWWSAVDAVRPGIRADRRDAFEEGIRAAAGHVPDAARLLACSPAAPVALARDAARRLVGEISAPVVEEADRLRLALQNLLDVEREESPGAVEPGRLRGAAGGAYTDAFDFDALSHLLDEAPHAAGLPPERRKRMEARAASLAEHVQALYGRSGTVLRPVSLRSAREAVAERTGRLLALYRDMEAARLEASHRYRPEIHDPYLEALTPAMLSPEDLRRCPPLVVTADEATLDAAGIGHLVELLAGTVPVKVLLVLRGSADDPDSPSAACTVPALAAGNGRAFVVQAALSDIGTLARGIVDAVRHDGPSLIAVHAGAAESDLPAYFASAVARDGRCAPSFVFAPAIGRPWAERLTVDGNDAPEADWTVAKLAVQGAGGGEEEIVTAFTWLDHALTRPALAGYFVPVEPDLDLDPLVPADEFLALGPEERAGKIPFVLCATTDGFLVRAVAARPLVCAAERALDRWRRLRELAGIGNSYAGRAVDAVRGEIEAERDAAIAAAEAAHARELDRTVASVAEAIVSNIAASLLDLPAGAPAPAVRPAPVAAAPAAAPGPAPEESTPAPPTAEEEPEESLSLDEAYIETVRCTSCNECTNLNGQIFAYNGEKQAFIKDASAGPYRDMVTAAEKCPVRIIHPGKPLNPDEPGLDELLERAKPFL